MLLAAMMLLPGACSKPPEDNAPVQTASFKIEGMTCQGCTRTITAALKMQPGVRSAKVDFDTSRATVEFSEGKVTPEQLQAAVEKAGYKAIAPFANNR